MTPILPIAIITLLVITHHPSKPHLAATPTIPTGNTKADIKARQQIIYNHYQQWKQQNPTQQAYNIDLDAYINIRSISIIETAAHAAKRYTSTLAVLQLDTILRHARRKGTPRPADPKKDNQRQFEKIQIMETTIPGIGNIKLTVGIRHRTHDYIQYCITTIE